MVVALLFVACSPDPEPWDWPASSWQDPGLAEPLPDAANPQTEALPAVVINELMADNDSRVEDEAGEEDDWIELVATSSEPIALGGWGLGLDPEAGPTWSFPAGAQVAPGDHLLVWLDGDLDQGPLHADLAVDADGGSLTLFGPSDAGAPPIDTWTWGPQATDLALARLPDGARVIAPTLLATPGNSNPWEAGADLDPSTLLFPQDRLLRIDLSMPQQSIEALADDPYSYVQGSVSLGAVTLSPVGIRIKGQWGSYRTLDGKSALKVSMDAFGGEARLLGLENLTLNNMVQDASLVHERLAFRLFGAMGVPAPRTAHVELWLNGEYRGLYLHVESADEAFLSRWFDNPEGNLYEGAYGEDLSSASYLQLDHDELGSADPDDYSDLAALAALLDTEPGESRVAELEALVDVDEVLAMWAVEVITGHWDGYFWYPNNYRVYHDPDSGRLSLLPWGVDQTFGYDGDIEGAQGALARWCLAIPSVRARYLLALWRAAEQMEGLGLPEDARATHARVLAAFHEDPYKEVSVGVSEASLDSTVDFIEQRPGRILDQLFPEP